ncbi:hypothetical protein AB0D11_48350 [Streptomyces monashensis]|uniref:hypothetical protein n=1 Tax=Streptomyces monashensis TaxID=1678012 RepID=UPI0033E9F701
MELLSALTRRQHEHRARTVARLTSVLDTRLLPAGLQEMALYYRARAYRDTGHGPESRHGYQQVADGNGRLAPAARRGLAQAARLAGDFPTAHTAAQTLGWEGRHQRVLGDLRWLQREPEQAAAAHLAGRTEAEQHGVTGEAAHNQALRALSVAFYDPAQADDEIDLAHQLLANLDLRATTINAAIAALIRDAGHPALDDRIRTLRTELDVAGLTSMTAALELAAAFHQAVLDDHDALAATLARLREQTRTGTTPTTSTSPPSWPASPPCRPHLPALAGQRTGHPHPMAHPRHRPPAPSPPVAAEETRRPRRPTV